MPSSLIVKYVRVKQMTGARQQAADICEWHASYNLFFPLGDSVVMHRLMTAAAVLFVLWLQGCAATGPKGAEMASTLSAVPPGYGRIVFYRSSSVAGAAVQPDIRLDGQVVGQSKPGGFFYVDASPGKHTASAATEATSTVDVQVMSGQTHYVRSAIGFGFVVGRVTLSVEGMITAKGELSSLSYTGTTVPRIGAAAAGAGASATPPPPQALQKVPPLKRGDQVIYRVTDLYTSNARDVTYSVDRIDGEQVIFNQGGRVERLDGTVVSNRTPLAGDLDGCAPPGGWGRPDMLLGMRWNLQYKVPSGSCSGDFDLQGQMVSDEVEPTPFGDLKVQRIDYRGAGLRGQFQLILEARVWYSSVLGRVVRFESEFAVRTGRSEPPGREKVELVAIRRD